MGAETGPWLKFWPSRGCVGKLLPVQVVFGTVVVGCNNLIKLQLDRR